MFLNLLGEEDVVKTMLVVHLVLVYVDNRAIVRVIDINVSYVLFINFSESAGPWDYCF